ncbi:PucR family transcriptional regulator [Saccharopolyspora sp. CA-218241]|uniref:PucR family transcriptional regulator n=1 Tax=Saccharopolyspora sp. CA-218241 TaxID=3240027 RepID=UPI003D95EB70
MIKLDRLVTVLGGYGVELVVAAGRDAELRSVAMHDPIEATPTRGDVFLAVGVATAVRAVELAAAAEAVAVLVHADAAEEVRSAAERSEGVAVLAADRALSWSLLAELVYGLVFEGRETESGRGPSDLFALADAVAAATEAPVTIEDRRSRVVAYSSRQHDVDEVRHSTILARSVPEEIRALFTRRGVFAHLAESDEPLFVAPSPEHGLRGRTVVAVRAGRELLGSLWATCDTPLPRHRAGILQDSARTVALHLLRSRVSADLERHVESELVIRLLEAGPGSAATLGKLGLAQSRYRVIALQAHADGDQHAAALLAFERATTGFGWSRLSRSALFGSTVYTILPCGEDPRPARDWLHDVTAHLPGHLTTVAGIGAPATPDQLPASRSEADECLALHASRHAGPPISYDESWDQVLLQRLRRAAASGRTPSRGPLTDLAHHDAAYATQYLPTLRAWLQAHGDLPTTAGLLDVHPNTVRYRMRRMHQITELPLDDPDKRLAMLISLAVEDGPG